MKAYTENMEDALRDLSLAHTYADDGALFDAIACAARAIGLLEIAYRQRRDGLETDPPKKRMRRNKK